MKMRLLNAKVSATIVVEINPRPESATVGEHHEHPPLIFPQRLRGWRFILFNAVLGAGHIIVLFSVGSYIALLPHAAGDLGGSAPGSRHA